ncbi:tetratricopeptide repeat protein [Nocardia jinanensis]|uniref:Tetratricopeptide repeat protein n=1 Tax=Nocardia jinanensis TaxID=382504 RepID=A0A917RBB8_9NOCA|nr:tetratricopeptide repeat protein [Nocardia jinanensis]GGK98549.1 hypothetical protein GCM10011588_11420 [Nocardia jinanensis]
MDDPWEFADALPLLLADAVWALARGEDIRPATDFLLALEQWSGEPRVSRAAAATALQVSFAYEVFVSLHRALIAAARAAWRTDPRRWPLVEALQDRAVEAEADGAYDIAADLLDVALELCEECGPAEHERALVQLDQLLPTLMIVLADKAAADEDAGRLARTARAVARRIEVLGALTGEERLRYLGELAEAHRIGAEYVARTDGAVAATDCSERGVRLLEELVDQQGPTAVRRLDFMWRSHIELLERFGETAAAGEWKLHRIATLRAMATMELTRFGDLTALLAVLTRLDMPVESAALSARLVAVTEAEADTEGRRSGGRTLARRLRDHGRYLHRAQRQTEAYEVWRRAVAVQAQAVRGAADEVSVVAAGYRNIVSTAEKLGDHCAAVEFGEMAAEAWLRFAETDRTAHLAAAVDELRAQAQRLRAARRSAEASDTAERAVIAARELTVMNAERYRPNLSWALTCAARMHLRSWRTDDAERRSRQAVALIEYLARAEPDRHRVALANALHNRVLVLNRRREYQMSRDLTARAVTLYEGAVGGKHDADLANVLCTQSIAAAALRLFDEALAAAARAETIYARLAESNPRAHLHDLAYALNRLASVHEDMGDNDAVPPLVTRVLEICDALPEGPVRDERRASGLHRMIRNLDRRGRPAEALTYSTPLVELRERMAAADPVGEGDELVIALGNHSTFLSGIGALRDALEYSRRGVELVRRLARADPQRFRRELAGALDKYAVCLFEDGACEEAAGVSREAVACFDALLDEDGQQHAERAARCFSNHALLLGKVGRVDEAMISAARGLGLLEGLAAGDRRAYGPALSYTLVNQAVRLNGLDRTAEGLVCAERAVALLDELTDGDPRELGLDLARALLAYSAALSRAGRHTEAVAAQRRAVRVVEAETVAEREQNRAGLARSTAGLASRLVEAGRWPEGRESSRAAVRLWRDLVGNYAHRYLPTLADALGNHAGFCRDNQEWAEAAEYAEQAASAYETLSAQDAIRYREDWAISMEYRAWALERSGQRDSASSALDRALDIRQAIAAESPATGLPALAHSEGWAAQLRVSLAEPSRAAMHWERSATLYEEIIDSGRDDLVPGLVAVHHSYATRSGRRGHRTEAVRAIAESVRWALHLVATDRVRHRSRLADALRDQIWILGDVGRRQEAVVVARAALLLGQEIAGAGTGDRRWHIADGHDLLADSLAEVGRLAEALELSARAVSLWEELAAQSDKPSDDLAWALWHRARWLRAMDDSDGDALRLSRRAVELYERVCADRRDRDEFFAGALVDHARHLSSAGDHRQALEYSSRAVAMWETLAAGEPRLHGPELAVCLRRHSLHLTRLARDDAALECARRALRLTENAVELASARFLPELAAACGVAADLLGDRDPGAAITLAERSVTLYTDLARGEPGVFGPRLVRARHLAGRIRTRNTEDGENG